MRKSAPWWAIAATAALLAGCSSNSGSTATSSSTSTSTGTSMASTSSAPASSDMGSSAMSSSAMGSSGMESSGMGSSGMGSSGMGSSGMGSSGLESSGASSGGSTPSSSAGPGFDKATTTWFGTFCAGFLKASVDTKTVNALLKGTVTAASKAPLMAGYQKSAADFTAAAEALAKLPAPTVATGQELATEVPKSLKTIAATITALEKQTAAVDATKNPSQLLAVAQSKSAALQSEAQAVVAPITKLDAATQNALIEIPACQELQTAITGG